MTNLTGKVIYQDYGDLLTTTNQGQGLSVTLEPLQDGLGQSSPISISLNAVNFDRSGMNTFQLDTIALTASATDINSVAKGNPILPGTGGTLLPSGTTAQRYSPPVNGVIRYNNQLNEFEGYVNGSWQPFDAGAVFGPNVSVAGDIAVYADTTGKLIADSGVKISDVVGPLLGPPPPGPLVTDIQLSGIDILSFKDVGLIFTGTGSTEDVYVCGFHPNSIVGKSPNTVFGFANPSSPDAIVELTQGAFLISRLDQTTINGLIDVDGMMVYNSDTDAFNFRQNGAWVNFTSGSITSILGTANEITATGGATVTIAIAANPILPGTASATLPTGTTAQRPGSPIVGDIRYNTDLSEFEGYNGAWAPFGSGGGSVTSITAGSNLTGGTITTTGTIALSNTPTGLTSIGVGNLELIANQLISTNTNGNIDLLPNGTGNILLGAAPVTITTGGIISSFGMDLIATGGNPALIEFFDANNSNFVALRAPDTVPSNYALLLPAADGTNGQGIITNGSGSLSFTDLANPGATFIVQTADPTLPNAQDLTTVAGGTGGLLKINNAGVVELAVSTVDYATAAQVLAAEMAAAASASAAASSATTAATFSAAAAASAVTAGVEAGIASSAAGSITGATSAKFIIQEINSNLPNAQVLATLSTGILKNTTTGPTGVLSIATEIIDNFTDTLFVGTNCGNETFSSTNNTGCGNSALLNISSGSSNTAMGFDALTLLTTAKECNAFGDSALGALTGGDFNTAFGASALSQITTQTGNCAFGKGAATLQNDYTDCIFIGRIADASVGGLTNAIAIGAAAIVSTSNSMVLGDGTVNVGIGTSSPLNKLHIVGSYQQKGITSGWTGTDLIKKQSSVQTTNATITTLLTIPIPTAIDTAVTVRVNLVALKTDGSAAAYGESFFGAFYNGTISASIGTIPTITLTTTLLFAVAAVWVVSGNNLLLQVTGIAATNINWVASYEYCAVTTSTA